MVGNIVINMGTTVQSRGVLYKEVGHLVLLYGSESLVVIGKMLKVL